ncbi:MAG: DUF3048 domain-containing protein [Actinomycetota bacterium]|nr:DUF3048 domain-containing protein [Actinomycetota bacterium]
MLSSRSTVRAVPTLATVLFLVAAACGGGGAKKVATAPTTTVPVVTTTTVPPVAPLTGLPLTDAAKLNRPALGVKIDNAPAARPQSGLDAADVVYEEVVEGGATRFLAIFQSTDAGAVGPVRSVRPSDPDIVAAYGALFAYSGGTPKFIDLLRGTPGVTDLGVDKLDEGADKPYTRRAGRTAPNNLYTSTANIYAKAPAGTKPPARFADFQPAGQPFAASGAAPAVNLTATVGMTTATFDYDQASGTYRRSGLVDGAGPVAPANVIVQFTNYQVSPGDFDVNGTAVEKAITVGSGDAIVMAGGMAVRGKWSKSSASAYTTYTDAAGAPIKLLPGRTWVELARTGAPATTR